MIERSQSFDVRDKNYHEIQTIMENILEKSLSFSTKTKRLGRSLVRITYFDNETDLEQQKVNRITILQETEKRVYIQIKGKLTDTQVKQLWNDFEKKIMNSTYIVKTEKELPSKEEIIQGIKRSIELRGYIIKNTDIQAFIENFVDKFSRLPSEEEYDSIVKGYIIMMNEDYSAEKTETSIKGSQAVERKESVLDISDDKTPSISYNSNVDMLKESVGRRKCPSCGDETSIHEIIDKSVILMDYPRIYGKKKYCGLCGFEWK
jgi:hypothetical protein